MGVATGCDLRPGRRQSPALPSQLLSRGMRLVVCGGRPCVHGHHVRSARTRFGMVDRTSFHAAAIERGSRHAAHAATGYALLPKISCATAWRCLPTSRCAHCGAGGLLISRHPRIGAICSIVVRPAVIASGAAMGLACGGFGLEALPTVVCHQVAIRGKQGARARPVCDPRRMAYCDLGHP